MKRNWKYIAVLVLTFGLVILIDSRREEPVDWRRSYTGHDKVPLGCYVLRELLPSIINEKITSVRTPVYNQLRHKALSGNYIIINETYRDDERDNKELLRFVEEGGNVFLSTIWFGDLGDSLGVSTISSRYFGFDSVKTNFVSPSLHADHPYSFARMGADVHFNELDSTTATVLGVNDRDQANYVRVERGSGAFYLSTLPMAFTNYSMLQKGNAEYVFRALSYLPQSPTFWDEYYKEGRREQQTPLRVILGDPALMMAYYLLLAAIVLFFLFQTRRRQRPIPIIAPPTNTTLEFAETVGMLYYQHGDHGNIAQKKINYFLEQIRTTYGVKTNALDEEIYQTIAGRSGVPLEQVRRLGEIVGTIQARRTASEDDLIALDSAIEQFHNTSRR